MAKEKRQGSNLRILSIAYAAGRLDRRSYVKLRTAQLGALEFGKPLPALPDELHDITVPQIKIDASYYHTAKRGKSGRWMLIAALLVLGAIGAGLWYALKQPPQAPAAAGPVTLGDHALRLLESAEWSERDIGAFSRQWAGLSREAKDEARRSQWWYRALENEAADRINRLKQRIDQGGGSSIEQRRLSLLQRFQAQLAAD